MEDRRLTPGGVLLVDKDAGVTSHDVVNAVRRLFGTKQVGHTGTLDPMATGLLILLIGRAVKASDCLLPGRKSYEAVLRLGIETDTEDTTGTVLRTCPSLPDEESVKRVCEGFVGEIDQIPPMFSALKKDGKKLVDLARAGIEVERSPRKVTVDSLLVKARDCRSGLYSLSVTCSKGTYIRTLCADIGKKLGCGGAMAALRREANGPFKVGNAHKLSELEGLPPDARFSLLLPLESAFSDLPKIGLPPFFRRLISSGCAVLSKKIGADLPVGTRLRLCAEEEFFALGEIVETEEGPAVRAVKQFILYDKEGKKLC